MRPKVGIFYRYAKAFLSVLPIHEQDYFVKKIDSINQTLQELFHNTHYKKLNSQNQEELFVLWAETWDLSFFTSFIKMIIENNKHKDTFEILQCVKEIFYNTNDITDISVITAKKLTPEEKKDIKSSFQNEKIITFHIDKSILGGTIIKTGWKIKDESTLAYLQDIQYHLSEKL